MILREQDIRPNELDAGKEAALRADLDWLAERKSLFVEVACPACASTSRAFAFRKYDFEFASCTTCETVYMNPRAPAEVLSEFYARSELYQYWERHIFPATDQVRRERIFRPRVARILEICDRLGVNTGCLVEVGAGFGTFCDEVGGTGRFERVVAVEPGAALAAHCRSVGLEVIERPVEDVDVAQIGRSADVVVAFEVIEHLRSPEDFLAGCRGLLGEGGILVVTCPNFAGFAMETLGPLSNSIDAEHINLFNPQSLRRLFERCGFEVLEWTTPGELDAELVRKKALTGEFDLSQQPLLRTILLDRWHEIGADFQEFLKRNGLSSHLWMIAKAPGRAWGPEGEIPVVIRKEA